MSALVDIFGRTVTVLNGTYSVPGISVSGVTQDRALDILNHHAPADYVAPVLVPTVISGAAFWARFTPTQQAAVATAAQSNQSVMLWTITALATVEIDLLDPKAAQGMAILGPSPGAGILSAAEITRILTP